MDAAPDRPWRPTRALYRAATVSALALLLATVLARPEPVLLAVPFALGTVASLSRRPARAPRPALTLAEPHTTEGGPVRARVTVDNDDPVPVLCVVSTQVSPWIRLRYGVGQIAAMLDPSDTTVVRLAGSAWRWGAQWVGPAEVRTYACDGLLRTDRHGLPANPLSVYPVAEVFESRAPLPRAAGMAGIHRSRRPGDGGELADVRPFQAGDRLRRVNWRVTRRTGEIHVNSTLSDRDADVLLVLDVRHEAGRSGGVGGASTVLDATVRAAAAIMEHYVHQGDRVALVEFSSRLRRLPARTGRRHVVAALEWLVGVDFQPTGRSPGFDLFTRFLRPTGALLVVLTPLLDTESVRLLAMLARSGRPLVAVDTLPPQVRRPVTGPWSAVAERLWRLERHNAVGRLGEVGVPVERWQGTGSLDAMLRHVSRLAASRVVRR